SMNCRHKPGGVMFRSIMFLTSFMALGLPGFVVAREHAAPLSALAKMPVREITIFKDGHAFVLHAGKMATDASGNVLLHQLPTPVIGTFWPYSADSKARLVSVIAAKRRVLVDQTALTLRDLLEANIGADILVNEGSAPYPATIIGFPSRTSEELAATLPPL